MMVEYEPVRGDGAGIIDLSASRGRIRVSGSEATMFLNGLITNDIKNATENNWLPAVFPTVQGRLIGAVRILRQDEGFLIDTESPAHEAILKTISRFTMAGDFRVSDVSDEMALLTVQGKGEGGEVQGIDATVVRATHAGGDSCGLLTDGTGGRCVVSTE